MLNRQGESSRAILIVGTGDQALELVRGIEKHRDLGLQIIGFLCTTDLPPSSNLNGYPIMGSAQDLPQLLEREVVDEVIFADPLEELKKMENLLLLCEERGITTRVILNFFPLIISKTHLEELDGFPLLTFSTTPKNELLLFLRRIFDFLGSLVFIFLFSPLFLLLTLLIRLDSAGPALYRQIRCGLNGRKFTCYKFRSMYHLGRRKENGIAYTSTL